MSVSTEVTAETRWETALSARYMAQLCKHFAHRLRVTLNERDGQIAFEGGVCDLWAEPDALRMRLTAADEEQSARLQGVVVRHLQRFAFRDMTEEQAAALPWVKVAA
ncbi:MAG TPA: DUF2218 domain-containing protein [Acidisoma sp.]|uniref:DUF2218 domain-containing protein n=1 Tax=Acidisoma sp. TaxID=1872115 RepID=UPI002B690069|nr:DUF2218 domain-containing protein [Acidisoma sp.]HTI02526.1 DUF2218 domain-containing protein [Acidisoma sp.]